MKLRTVNFSREIRLFGSFHTPKTICTDSKEDKDWSLWLKDGMIEVRYKRAGHGVYDRPFLVGLHNVDSYELAPLEAPQTPEPAAKPVVSAAMKR